eukprot:1092334-Karenia_brevis.AAC.1
MASWAAPNVTTAQPKRFLGFLDHAIPLPPQAKTVWRHVQHCFAQIWSLTTDPRLHLRHPWT